MSLAPRFVCPSPSPCPHRHTHASHTQHYYHTPTHEELCDMLDTYPSPLLVEGWERHTRIHMIDSVIAALPAEISNMAPLITDYARPSLRSAFRPVFTQQDDVSVTHSKCAGRPYISRDALWPECADCDKRMAFLVQINLSHVPDMLRGVLGNDDEMLQVFMCPSDDTSCGSSYDPFSAGNCARVVNWQHDARMDQSIPDYDIADFTEYHHRVDTTRGGIWIQTGYMVSHTGTVTTRR